MTDCLYGSLGASLYVPATHQQLDSILREGCHHARSLIICTEDAVADSDVTWAVHRLIKALKAAPHDVPHLRFVRPRTPSVLATLLAAPEAMARLDGVVIPKFDGQTAGEWQAVLDHAPTLAVMPTLETRAMFRDTGVDAVLCALQKLHNPIIALRIGANDLLGILGIKRQPGQTVYDTPLRGTLERIVTTFRPAGYELAAPVCDLIDEPETLGRELAQDIAWGFYAKTCIHPTQIDVVEAHFTRALSRQQDQANALLHADAAVFRHEGQMLEKTCHGGWAHRVSSLKLKAIS